METPTEAPAAAAPEAVADLTLDQIVAQAVQAADTAGADVVKTDPPAEAPKTEGADATPPAEGEAAAEPAAEEPKADDVTAARVRKMLAKVEEREAALGAREAAIGQDFLAQLLKAPKATLAKIGKSIDDVIDASLAEGKEEPGAAAAPADDRLTALERRIEARERAEAEARDKAIVAGRIAEIQGSIAASPKFPTLNDSVKAGKVEASVVTDYMVEYHARHGKPIAWDRAAAAIEADLKALRGTPAPAARAAEPPARADTVSIGGDQRTAAPTAGDELPEDPALLLKFLVAQAGGG